MSLIGKVAIVTGASRGIGRAIAIELAKQGVFIGANYNIDEDGIKETVRIVKEANGYIVPFKADVSSYKETQFMFDNIVKELGSVDILVNNAGVSQIGLFSEMKIEEWNHIIDTNLKSVFNCSHNAVKYMLSRKSGSIINISSIWGESGASCEVAYSTSKGGINAFTKSLALELAPSNIRVNAIAPGIIDTRMNSNLSSSELEMLKNDIPVGRLGIPMDVAGLAVFLSEERSNYITGQVITVDGGYKV